MSPAFSEWPLTEALGRGFAAAGVTRTIHYPGYGASELAPGQPASASERTAVARAWGRSLAGQRVVVSIKAVGLGDAADALTHMYAAGVRGGVTIVVFDDPQVEASQSVFDARWYETLAPGIWLEPQDPRGAFDLAYLSLALSEATALPVMMRVTGPARAASSGEPVLDEPSPWTRPVLTATSRSAAPAVPPVVHPGFALGHHRALEVRLRLASSFVAAVIAMAPVALRTAIRVGRRRDVLGLPDADQHAWRVRVIDDYEALMQPLRAAGHFVVSDLGTFTLDGARTTNACLCYGAAVSVAAGYAEATSERAVALIGDAALLHSGVIGLLEATWRNDDIAVIVIDNRSAVSTGGQVTGSLDMPGLRALLGAPLPLASRDLPARLAAALSSADMSVLRILAAAP